MHFASIALRGCSATRFRARWTIIALVATTSACTATSDQSAAGDDSAARSAAGASTAGSDSMAGHNMAGMSDSTHAMGMAGMTGNADQDFLRMMSDHHKGLIEMAHLTMEDKRAAAPVQADAEKLDGIQDAELDSMVTKLEGQFKDPYSPRMMPSNQAMLDDLKAQSAPSFARTFYQNVVKHHQEAIKMIDQSMPTMKDAAVRAMAERMKRDQTREIAEYQKKASVS